MVCFLCLFTFLYIFNIPFYLYAITGELLFLWIMSDEKNVKEFREYYEHSRLYSFKKSKEYDPILVEISLGVSLFIVISVYIIGWPVFFLADIFNKTSE